MKNSLMLVTALAPKIGYDRAAAIAPRPHREPRCGRRRSASAMSRRLNSTGSFGRKK
jgi:fumarate hydratase class II